MKKSMKNTPLFIGSILFIIAIAVTAAYAFPGLDIKTMHMKGYGENSTYNDTATIDALKNNNYNAYLSALDARYQAFRSSITQDVFSKMTQDYQNKTVKMQQMQLEQSQITQAIKDNSYTEWQSAIKNLPKTSTFASKITAANFDTYVQLYNAQQSKNWTEVKTLSNELGIKGIGTGFDHMSGGGKMPNRQIIGHFRNHNAPAQNNNPAATQN